MDLREAGSPASSGNKQEALKEKAPRECAQSGSGEMGKIDVGESSHV